LIKVHSRTLGHARVTYLDELRDTPITIAAATHGGVTDDLLRPARAWCAER
jgi:hypothetical protein